MFLSWPRILLFIFTTWTTVLHPLQFTAYHHLWNTKCCSQSHYFKSINMKDTISQMFFFLIWSTIAHKLILNYGLTHISTSWWRCEGPVVWQLSGQQWHHWTRTTYSTDVSVSWQFMPLHKAGDIVLPSYYTSWLRWLDTAPVKLASSMHTVWTLLLAGLSPSQWMALVFRNKLCMPRLQAGPGPTL